jgi:hypothetical protein
MMAPLCVYTDHIHHLHIYAFSVYTYVCMSFHIHACTHAFEHLCIKLCACKHLCSALCMYVLCVFMRVFRCIS